MTNAKLGEVIASGLFAILSFFLIVYGLIIKNPWYYSLGIFLAVDSRLYQIVKAIREPRRSNYVQYNSLYNRDKDSDG